MFQKFFLNGLKAFVPVVVTIAILIWIFSNLEAFFGNIIRHLIPENYYFGGLGILVGIVFVFVLGVLINAWAIKQLYQLADAIVKKIPFIKTIYSSIQDLVSFIEKSQDKDYNQVVMCRIGKFKLIGFVTRQTFEGLPDELGGKDQVLVYLPMSYQIGGYMISMPRKYITPIDMPANKAMTFILTAGMLGTQSKQAKELLKEQKLRTD